MDLLLTADLIKDFIIRVGDEALTSWEDLGIEKHADGVDVTTSTDIKIEHEFYNFIQKHFPDHGFRGEELGELNRDGEYIWQIDPIDGTKYYAQQVPFWTVTIALTKNNKPILGMIYNPISKQLHHASKGNGAYLNNKRISLSPEIDIKKLQISVDIALSEEYFTRKAKLTAVIEELFSSVYRVRIIGAGAISLAWLAQGFFGAFVNPYRPGKKIVDVSGGLIIAEEAGAEIYQEKLTGENDLYNILVARSEVLEKLLPIFKV